MLGEEGERTFANLYSMVDYETATSTILDVCTQSAREAMEDTATNDPLMRMVGVNIIEKLRNELNTEEKIEAFVKECIAYARTYVQFNPEETGKVINNGTATPSFVNFEAGDSFKLTYTVGAATFSTIVSVQ